MELSWEQRRLWFCKHVITNQQKLFSTRSSTRVTHQVVGKASLKGKRSGFYGPIPLKPFLRKISKNFENRLIERGYPAAIVRKYLSEVKFADRKTAP